MPKPSAASRTAVTIGGLIWLSASGIPAFAQNAPPSPPAPPANMGQPPVAGMPPMGHKPPPNAFEDCKGKAEGASVQHMTPQGQVMAKCMMSPDGMVARPDHPPPPMGSQMPDHPPAK